MIRVIEQHRIFVIEYGFRFLKGNPMLFNVYPVFVAIPFEIILSHNYIIHT